MIFALCFDLEENAKAPRTTAETPSNVPEAPAFCLKKGGRRWLFRC